MSGLAAPDAHWIEGTWSVEDGVIHRRTDAWATAAPADLVGWIIPGLVDAHCHIGIGRSGTVDRSGQETQVIAAREAGVLAVRDCGVPVDNSWIHSRDDLPVLVRAGHHLARPKRYIGGLALELEDPTSLPDAIAAQARVGDGWVKLVGDWIDRSRGAESDLDPLWSREVLIDAVAAAHEAGARVAVHAFSHTAIDELLDARVDDIEHGCGMDDEQMARAARSGVLVTPTVRQIDLFEGFAAAGARKYPRYAATMRAMFERRADHARALFDSGVSILPGTDAGGYQDHGSLPDELLAWERLGIGRAQILDLATWRARDALGLPTLSEGAPADLVVCVLDPREDLSVLTDPEAVVLRGCVVGGRVLQEA